MSAVIIEGKECMDRRNFDLCAKYNISARVIPLKKGGFVNRLGKSAFIFPGMDTVSHPLVISAIKGAKSTAQSWSSCPYAALPPWSAS